MFTLLEVIVIAGIAGLASIATTYVVVSERANREDVERLANLARYMSEEYKRES